MSTAAVNGAFVGLIYGLFALGLVVVYRGSRVINFAHGETGMIGAFVFAELWASNHVPLAIALPVGITLSAVIGAATEWFIVRPLRGKPRLNVLVGTFGLAGLLIVFASRRYGVDPRYLKPMIGGRGIDLAGVTIRPLQLVIAGVSVAVLAALTLLYSKTSFGLRLRATAINPEAAAQLGVNTDAVSIASWAIAGGLAGASAVLIAPLVIFNVFFMTALMLRGLVAALLGGLTNLAGAFAAGVAIGVAEGVLGYQVSSPGFVEFSLAVLVIVVLLARPRGLAAAQY